VDRLRTFIAVDLEDPILLSKIERVKDFLIATGVPMKPVESRNLHITLRFIGEVPVGVVEEIKRRVLSGLKFEKFRIHLRGLGAFPGSHRPRVVWIGVSEGSEDLVKLHNTIESSLRSLGIPPERGKTYTPHLTIARVRGSRNLHALVRLILEYEDYDFGWMTVESIRLKKSVLTRPGPIYETLWEVKAIEG